MTHEAFAFSSELSLTIETVLDINLTGLNSLIWITRHLRVNEPSRNVIPNNKASKTSDINLRKLIWMHEE